MAQKIEIPVSLNAQIDNLKQIRSTLINTVNAAGKESTLAKTLTKDLGKVDEQIRELENISLQPTINESEFRHIQTIFDRLTKQFQSSFTQIDLSGFEQIASEADINRLKSLTQEASKYRKELEAIQKAGSSEKTEAFLTRTNRQLLLDQGRTLKGFDSTATLNKNATAMEKAAESYRRSANELQDALDTLDQEATDASNRARTIKDRVDNLTAQHQTLRTDSRIADFHYRAASLETNFSANSQMSNPTVGSIRTGLRRTLETVYADGKIATDAREAVSDWIKKLAPNISTTEAARMVQQDLTTLLEDLMEEIFGAGYRADNDLLYNPNHSAMLSRAQGYSRAEINRLNRKHSTATVADIGTRTKEVQQQLKQEQAEYQKINNEINKKQAKWDELDEQQSSYLNAANEASKLSQELYTLAAAEQAAAEAAKQAQIAQNEAEQDDLKNRIVSGVKGSAAPGPGQVQGLRGNLKGFEEETGERYSGEKAAEEFKHNLQMSIRQWMSAQQVVNIIKDGLRQAIQDIKGLDQAMTNIAVVTDMSVGDLWGKINDYMAIAQQYGVTTQGVYEVSQLYYQQGLSTSEVMAATTETLKMARIAGMDYAEAADAMTVAIRAFKMEMSDAQTVTDVYSKVAAVTASDSEELAIAMSKTASSAESVGSSFENTTAMLAVMIETTRESAQNLGSALKSIISRYGEMKTGLTVDSEGEAIDYNKVDTALKSVGISIKDAQGQFRDFDDVIFELSEKWDTLDKNTQRYIATIMAGNRQQSRFIALVDNWERLDEVATAAQDSEDAGLLQYAKTLDSLETKINNIKTSFQEFYMSILNGPVFGAVLEFVNNLIKGFNKLGLLSSAMNLGSIIVGLKTIGSLIVNSLSSPLSNWTTSYKKALGNFVIEAAKAGHQAGTSLAQNFQAGQQQMPAIMPKAQFGKVLENRGFLNSNGGKITISVASLLGAGLSAAGSVLAGNGQQSWGAGLSMVGSGLSGIAQGALMGGIPGAVIGGIAGVASGIPALVKALDANTIAENKLAEAREDTEEKNIKRAETKENYNNLKSLLAEYNKAQETRYSSDANYQEWINVNNQLVEAYPALLSYIDAEGNAIADVTQTTQLLDNALKEAALASKAYYDAKIAEAKLEYEKTKGHVFRFNPGEIFANNTSAYWSAITGDLSGFKENWLLGEYVSEHMERNFAEFTITAEQLLNSFSLEDFQQALRHVQSTGGTEGSPFAAWLQEIEVLTQSDGNWAFSDAFSALLEAQRLIQNISEATKGSALNNLSILSASSNIDDDFSAISGYVAWLRAYAQSAKEFKLSDEDIAELDTQNFEKIATAFKKFYSSLNIAQQNILASLYDNLETYSLGDIKDILTQDFKLTADSDLYSTFMLEWYNKNFFDMTRLAQAFIPDVFKNDESLISYEIYKGEKQDSTQLRQEYAQAVEDYLIENNIRLYNFLYNNAASIADNFANTFLTLDNIISGNGDTNKNFTEMSIGSVKASKQKSFLSNIQYGFYTQLNELLGESDAIEAEFYSILFENIGSQDWAESLEQFAEKYGTTLQSLFGAGFNVANLVFENFSTKVQSIADSLDSTAESWKNLSEKQTKGFTNDQANALLKQLGENATFDNTFKITSEGLIVLQDFVGTFNKLYEDEIKQIEELKTTAAKNKEILENTINKAGFDGKDEIFQGDAGFESIQEYEQMLSEVFGLEDSSLISTLASRMAAENTDIKTYEDLVKAIDEYYGALNQSEQYLKLYKNNLIKETIRQSSINALYGGEEQRKNVQVYGIIASRGAYGYTGEEVQNLIEEYKELSAEDFELQADGTFDLVDAYKKLKDLKVPQYVLNAVSASIESTVDSAAEGLTKLAESAANREILTPNEIREKLGDSAQNFSDEMAEAYYKIFTDIVGSGTPLDETNIKASVTTHFQNLGYEGAELDEAVNNFMASFSDSITDSSVKVFELRSKALQGELTKAERNVLKLSVNEADIVALENKTNEAIAQYISDTIARTDITFKQKTDEVKKALTVSFEEAFGPDIGKLGQTAVQGMFDSQDAAADFMSKFYNVMGETVAAEDIDVSTWFTRDSSGQYRLDKTISELRAELAEVRDTADKEEIENLENQLTYYEGLQKVQRKESLISSFSSMATAEEIRASELMKLYEDQGKTLDPQIAQNLAESWKNLDPVTRLDELVNILKIEGIEIDTETYRKAVNAAKVSFQATNESIKTAAENLGSKIVTANDELQDYMNIFGDDITEANMYNYRQDITTILSGEGDVGQAEDSLKAAIAKNLGDKATEEKIQEVYNALFDSADDTSYGLVDTVFNAKIEALESGHLSAANREILKAAKEDAFIEDFAAVVSASGDELANLIFKEKAKAYDAYFGAKRITKAEQLDGIASSAADYFASLQESIEASTKAYLSDATASISEGDRAYSTNELGKLYAAAREKAGGTLDQKEFLNEYVKVWNEAGEAILDVKKLKEKGFISSRQAAEFSESLVNNVFSAAEDVINKMSSGLNVDNHEVQAIFDELGMSLDETEAENLIKGGYEVLLNRMQLELMMAGADSSDISEKIKELQVAIIDMITESLTSGFSALAEGLEGTLSEASYFELQKLYGLSNTSARTSKGVSLNRADQQKLISALYGKAAANGRTAGFGEELWKTLSEAEDNGFKGYKDIQKEIDKITEGMDEATIATDGYVQALEAAKQAAMEAADAADFAFMEQDGYDGKADTFDKFTENVTKAKEALATFKKGGKVAHADLTAMFDVIKSGSEESIAKFETSLSKAGGNMEEILHSMLNFVDTTGKIDLSKWATKMGIDIETATSAMSEGMSDALMATAKDQIKYLSGLEAMLKAMVALEEIGSIDLSLSFIGDDGQVINLQLSEILETWDKLSQTEQIELQTAVEQKFIGPNGIDYTAGAKSLTEALGFKGSLSTLLFGKEGIDGKQDLAIADAFGTFAENIRNMSEGEIETVALKMRAAMKDFMIFDDEGNVTAWKEGYERAFQKFLSGFDFTNIAESLNSKLSEALATKGGKITIPFKEGDLVIESAGADGLKITGPGGKMLTELSETQITAVKESLAKQLGMAVEDIEIDTKTGLVNFYGETAKTETEAIKTEFQSLEEAAAGVAEQTNFLQQTIAAFEVSEGFQEFVRLLNQITGGTQIAAETVEGAAQLANLGKEINAEGEGNGLQLKVDISEAIAAFEKLQTQFEALAEVLSTPITIDVKSVGTITAGAPVVESQSGNTQGEGAGAGVNTITTHTVQILWEVPQPDFDSIEEPIIGFQWKKPGPTVPAPAKTPTISFYWASNSTPPKYTGKPVEIPTVLKTPSTGDGNSEIQQVAMVWTGTMNDISGTAFADGSIGRLYSGAQLAGKTLVGELGPELAVYDGQYHLLGQHGAEFINLPSDAIVFNHKQTEGIARGQFNIRGKAMADGNVTGPAMAGGAAAALAAVQRAKSLWQGLLDDLTAAQLAGGSNGGGGGNTLQAVKEELQEWYNLSRQIANVQQEINNLLAERANIPQPDGEAYLRSLRKQQELLQEQVAIREILLGYQELQLQRQAEQINTNKIWSQFLEVDANGLLQYTKGNELFGGKGALEVLSDLNKMSGEEQLKFLKELGYTAKNQDGEELKDSELIQKFYEELQLQIDEYDQLYDAIHETSETLEELQTEIKEINDEITKNQMALEEDIFNILVDAWEAEIEALEEQKDLIEEANDAYISGLNEALQAERDMYSEEQSIADREQLQRQLSLLRRSGGSASEIANLEKQLDGMLQDEYFRNQEKMIQSIEDASEEQVRQLEHQIRLQEDALEFEKEHGILWTKVYEVMSGSADQILQFMQGNSPEFFSQSLLQQEKMLTDWAHKIGIYTENRSYEDFKSYAQSTIWDTGDIWTYSGMSGYKDIFNSLTAEQQEVARERFNTTYANSSLAGEDHNTAIAKAKASLLNYLADYKQQQDASQNKPETDEILPGTGGDSSGDTSGEDTLIHYTFTFNGAKYSHYASQASAESKINSLADNWYYGSNGYSAYVDKYRNQGMPAQEAEAKAQTDATAKKNSLISAAKGTIASGLHSKGYSQGGLVDYTGPAIVHGSPSKPEAFLNAKQTAMISEAVKFAGDGGALDGIKATLNALNASIKSIVNNNRNEISSFTVAPGAVTIQVAELSDSYDVEELSRDVMNRMVAIASKSTNRGVSRR